ncbi:MAG: hypothetical protein AB1749_01125 [Pseudomonadota bacterium]
MAYAASIDRLLDTLRARAREKADALAREKRVVRHGLLSVGLKLHCLAEAELFDALIEALGGESSVLERNVYKCAAARFCLVLPPVGSAETAILLLECIEQYTGCRIFDNPSIQLQVCSPGRLAPRNAALHAIGFYLGSDTLREYVLDDFATTVSEDYYHRGKRIVIYDAGPFGDFDCAFPWWARTPAGLAIRPTLPFLSGRTDVLVGSGSRLDIHNINLLATLLVHAQSSDGDGYWSELGTTFIADMAALLDRHLLGGVVDAPWICPHDQGARRESAGKDPVFFSALQELTAYAMDEASRLARRRLAIPGGILNEMQNLLADYRSLVTSTSEREHGDAA